MSPLSANVFSKHILLLQYLGVTISSETTRKTRSFLCYFVFIQLMLTINTVLLLLTMLNNFTDNRSLSLGAVALVLFLISIVTQIKLILIKLNSALLSYLFDALDTPGARVATTDMLTAVNVVIRAYATMLVTLLAAWLAYPWLTGDTQLPIPYWLPFEVNSFQRYIAVYCYLSFVIAIECYTQEAVDTLLLLIAGEICHRLYAIRSAFYSLGTEKSQEKLISKLDRPQFDRLGLSITRDAWLSKDEILLKESIKEHVYILRLIRTFDAVLDDIFLAQVLQSTLVSTMYFFVASKSDNLIRDFPKSLFILLATFTQFFMYCWLGEEISQHSDDIHRSIYLSHWYRCHKKIMKSLVIVETFTKSHFKLQGGHLFCIDLKTFVMVVRESFSYFMVLRAVLK